MTDDLKSFEEQLKQQITGAKPKEENSLKSFEDQLKKQIKGENPSNLKEFEEQLKAAATKGVPGQPMTAGGPTGTKQIKVQKNILISFVSDATGCGHIRNVFPMQFLNSIFAKQGMLNTIITPFFLTQQELLARARMLFFQRQMTQQHYNTLSVYKKFQPNLKYTMAWDMDDMIWGLNEEQGGTKEHGVPTYNFGSKNITKEVKKWSIRVMELMDVCTFSTQFLADYAKNELKVKAPCVVVPNSVSQFFWGEDLRPMPTAEELKKPRVIYTGSPTHYHNQRKKLGDWDNAWRAWVTESVKEDKIHFICLGGLPWFFENIKDKIQIEQWVDSFRYHTLVKRCKAHIGVMPLVPNDFNYSKSDIKYIEHCADGVPAIGTVFENGKPSPYDDIELKVPNTCTVEDINKIVDELKDPEYYKSVRDTQRKKLDDDGRWLESIQYVNYWKNLLQNPKFSPIKK